MLRPMLLALLAGLAGTATWAGDANVKPKAPNPCARYGAGFAQMPGSDSCVRVGASVRFDAYSGTAMSNAPSRDLGDGEPSSSGAAAPGTSSSYDPWKQTR